LIIALIAGLISGYLLSAPPIGPTNFAVIAKGFKNQKAEGIAIGAGAGTVDMFYILVAYGGVSLLKSLVPEAVNIFIADNESYFKMGITIVGCLVVFILGFKMIKNKSFKNDKPIETEIEELEEVTKQIREKEEKEISKIIKTEKIKKTNSAVFYGFMTGVLSCLSSVTLPASWIAIVGYLKSYNVIDGNVLSGFLYATGVLAGTILWFWTLVYLISRNAHKIKPVTLNIINVVVGIILIALGIFLLFKTFDYAFT